ncbi:aspartic peptidase domain-containing protein [Chaetomidium leptoderma]|uniref:Aspartic peptidase domain-containing protein n=1 Tax=Chaetomidium leptoderma TaxID=669021 RepID=A0AAN6VGJ4_9PEZI|nr:aspartic peptidase domain-containing protein [Chaetomidium leptoderma]
MALHTRFSTLALCAALGAATAAAAQHVLLPFSQRNDAATLAVRASEQAALKSSEYAYVVDVAVGTPAQKLSLLISPSTGDTWVPDANTVQCSPEWYYGSQGYYDYYDDSEIPAAICHWGSFNKSLSSTHLEANYRSSSFGANYVDGTYVSGYNMTDKLVIGDLEFDDYPMGLVSSAYRYIGILGIGRNTSSNYRNGPYANIMDRMVSSGKIASPAYSIWLDNAQGTTGGLLFGAIDQSRYTGDLVRLTSYSSSYSSSAGFTTIITSINGTDSSGSAMPPLRTNDFPLDVTIGPAEVFSYLPGLIADQFAAMAGATYNSTLRYYTIPCDAAKTNNTKLVIELGGTGGPKLNVETADLVLPARVLEGTTRAANLLDGTNTCLFGVQKYYSSSSSSYSESSYYFNLGSSFLRRTYIVFDLANRQIAVAPVKFASGSNAPSPTIVPFATYVAVIPSSTTFCTDRYCPDSDDGSGSGNGNRNGSGSRYGDPSSSLAHWEKVAIGVGVGFGVLILIGVVAGIIVCKRLRRGEGVAKEGDEEEQDGNQTPPAENPVVAQNGGTRSSVVPPGALPVIQDGAEPSTLAQAPQLPALGTQLARPITPPAPTASANSNRSVAVSALSDDQPGQESAPAPEEAAAAPRSPKGKGKEVDRSAGES